jgi:uncharacterized protein (TIGR00730 family)
MYRLAVFCGAETGNSAAFVAEAELLGRLIAERGLTLVYGGSSRGLMGVIGQSALRGGAEVIGVMPLVRRSVEVPQEGVSQMIFVDSLYERKLVMAALSNAFCVLPGGFGTLDEITHILLRGDGGTSARPCALLNLEGYYDPLLQFVDSAIKYGFLRKEHKERVKVARSAESILDYFRATLAQ